MLTLTGDMIFNCNSDLATSVLIGWGNSTAFVKIVYPVLK